MIENIEISRNSIRYERSDIRVEYSKIFKNCRYAELFNISQKGMSIRLASNLKFNKSHKFIINFGAQKSFVVKGVIVSKSKDLKEGKAGLLNKFKRMGKCSNYNYGVCFNQNCDDYQAHLLSSNIHKKLKYYKAEK